MTDPTIAATGDSATDAHVALTETLAEVRGLRGRGEFALALQRLDASIAPVRANTWVRLLHAELLSDLGRHDDALAGFRELGAEDDAPFQARLGAARSLRHLQGPAAALPELEAVLMQAGDDPWVRMAYAETLRDLGRYQQAHRQFEKLLESSGDRAEVHHGLAQCVLHLHGADAALRHFDQAIKRAPTDVWLRLGYADALRDSGRLKDAAGRYKSLLRAEQPPWQAHMGLARCLQLESGPEAALPHLRAALDMAPDEQWVQLSYAEVLGEAGHPDDAERFLEQMLAINPQHPQALIALGRLRQARLGAHAARPLFESAVELAPNDPWIRLARDELLLELWQYEEAEKDLRALCRDYPAVAQAQLALAQCLQQTAGINEALTWYESALTAAPGDAWVRLRHAHALLDAGAVVAARERFERIAEDGQVRTSAQLGVARCEILQGQIPAALRRLTPLAASDAIATSHALELAKLLCDAGDFVAAEQVARQLRQRAPAYAVQALASLAQSRSQQGAHREAITLYEEACTLHTEREADLVSMIAAELSALGDFQGSERRLRELLAKDPSVSLCHVRLAETLAARGHLAAAFTAIQDALRCEPQHPAAGIVLASIIASAGELQPALDVLTALWPRRRGMADIPLRAASVLRRVGRLDEAAAWVDEGLQFHPANLLLHLERARVDLARGDTLAAAARLRDLQPGNRSELAELHAVKGQCAELAWQHADAIRHYELSLDARPLQPQMYLALAIGHLIVGQVATAYAHLLRMTQMETLQRLQSGASANVSQSHLGQYLDEYLIDETVLQQIAGSVELPPNQKLQSLLSIVRTAPQHTPAAAALVITLRQAGLLEVEQTPWQDPPLIPRRITQYWDSAAVPPGVMALMASWPQTNPDFEYRHFDDESAKAYLLKRFGPQVSGAFAKAREPAMRADYFRLACLLVDGGVYADADDRCHRPLTQTLPGHADLVVWQEVYGTIGNNVMAAAPGHPVIRRALALATEAILRGDDELLWLATGPGLLTRALVSIISELGNDFTSLLQRSAILTQAQLTRGVAIHCYDPYKITRRHWSRSVFAGSSPRSAPPQ